MTETQKNQQPYQGTHGPLSRFADWIDTWSPVKLLRVLEVIAILAALVAFAFEVKQRPADRAVRVATLFAQIAEALALPGDKGVSAVKVSLHALVGEGVDMTDIGLRGANLSGVNLSGAILNGADLTGAVLTGADLTGADLTGANLSEAILSGTNFSGTDLTTATNLTQPQLGLACRDKETKVPADLKLPHCKLERPWIFRIFSGHR